MTYQPSLEMDWETVQQHLHAGSHHGYGNRSSRIRRIMRILGLLGPHETLTPLGVRLERGDPGVLQQVLEETVPAAFHTPPTEFESLWPLASPGQARRYANNLRRMVAAVKAEGS